MLYLFPGLQDVDWVPIVDPIPADGTFDIIQPVLEYPDQGTGRGWSVRSWWCVERRSLFFIFYDGHFCWW